MQPDKCNKLYRLAPYKRGFTLIEIIIATFISGILSVLVYDFISQSMFMQNFISDQSTAISEARKGLEDFTAELREATSADTGAYALDIAEPQSITFYSDIDQDIGIEKVRYYLENGNFMKGVIESSGNPPNYNSTEEITIISSSVVNSANPVFTYFDQNYPIDQVNNPLTAPVDISSATLVKIHLDVNVNPSRAPDTYSLESFVQIRNFKNNL